MLMKKLLFLFSAIVVAFPVFSQNDVLRNKIQKIIEGKDATVGVALIVDGKDTLTINNNFRYPTQSVYKFHFL